MNNRVLYIITLLASMNAILYAAEEKYYPTFQLPGEVRPLEETTAHLLPDFEITVESITEYINRMLPTALDDKASKAPKELASRIIKLYSDHLADDPNFYQLIEPLITIEPDAAGSCHLSIVMSDFYLSCLHLYEKLKFFTYGGLLKQLEKPNGHERYMFAMKYMSSFSHPTELSRIVWHNIFTLSEDRFEILKGIMVAADKYPLFKLEVLPEVFKLAFQRQVWDEKYWDRFSLALNKVDIEIEKAEEHVQKSYVPFLFKSAL